MLYPLHSSHMQTLPSPLHPSTPPSLSQVGQKIDDLYQDFRDGNKLLLLLELLCNVKLVRRKEGREGRREEWKGGREGGERWEGREAGGLRGREE